MSAGYIKTLYSDSDKTIALYPRTKTSAVSDSNNRSVDYLLDKKQNKLTAGDNITITSEGTISAVTSATYTAGDGITISSDDKISSKVVYKPDTSTIGNLTILKITQADFEALTTKDENTLYLIY